MSSSLWSSRTRRMSSCQADQTGDTEISATPSQIHRWGWPLWLAPETLWGTSQINEVVQEGGHSFYAALHAQQLHYLSKEWWSKSISWIPTGGHCNPFVWKWKWCWHWHPREEDIVRLTEHHFVSPIPETGSKRKPQKRCRVCYKKGVRKDNRYHCACCPSNPGLCYYPCFELYHTQLYCDKKKCW